MPFFVEVILPLALPKPFTYSITEAEYNYIKLGMRIAVPFGKSKVYTGIAINLHTTPPQLYEAKDIDQILDEKPIVTQQQLKHWEWIASYYMCNIGDVYRSAMPSAYLLESETIIVKKEEYTEQNNELTDEEYLIYEALQNQSALKIQEATNILNKKNILPVINKLLAKNAISLREEVKEKYKPKRIKYVKLRDEFLQQEKLNEVLEILSRAQKQREAVLQYFQLYAVEKSPLQLNNLSKPPCIFICIKDLNRQRNF